MASASSLTGAPRPPAGLVPAPEAAATGAARRSPVGVVVATGGVADHRPLAVGPLIPGPAPTLVATDAVAAKRIAEKVTGVTEGPRHAVTRFAIIQTVARRHWVGPHDAEITDPALDPHNERGDTETERDKRNVGCPGLRPQEIEAPRSLHSVLQV